MTEAFDYDKLPTGPDGRKHCKTRDGRDVTLLCNDAPGKQSIVGWVTSANIGIGVCTWRSDGSWVSSRECNSDLVMPSRKRWVNLYAGTSGTHWWLHFETREEADRAVSSNRVACVEVEL